MDKKQKLFIGFRIHFSERLNKQLVGLRQTFQSHNIKWVSPENYHVTLKFLGIIEPYFIPSIKMALSNILTGYEAFSINIDGLDVFTRKGKPKVLFCKVSRNDALAHMANSIQLEMEQFGFGKEYKYTPHVTIARIKHITNGNKLEDFMEIAK